MHFVGVSAIALFLVLSESAVNGDEAPSCTRCKNLVKMIREKETTDLKKALFTEVSIAEGKGGPKCLIVVCTQCAFC